MTVNRVYLDTSAYLSVLLGEAHSQTIIKAATGRTLCSSTFLLIEAERNLVHLLRSNVLDDVSFETAFHQLESDVELFLLREFSPDLCLNREFPLVRTPKSADLVHLRSAIWFQKNGGLDLFITLDQTQSSAAREMGLPVWVK